MRFILASASTGRLGVLRAAGIDPIVRVSGVDEDAITARLGEAGPAEVVAELARAKAAAVADSVRAEFADAVVVGCDSMLHAGGQLQGKPHEPEIAAARWTELAGTEGRLLTGHCVIRLADNSVAVGTESTTVRFGKPTDAERDAYIATGEPLHVAGGFTLDGYGGWFIESVDGVPSSVIGISLPLTRRLLGELGISVTRFWG
ncbi:Maf family protein [Sciscionella sediminilitoris]|uniref:Maf family protein n=1 Tax=Sciscionella sediminilitoris TaxID=1445613 RepID=UPI0004DEE9A6|nr:Maf family nucleotide pyrophosphatase [Sciscionella sp. SE31]